MNALEAWLEQQARREASAACLEDALIAGRFRAYASHRLRFFLLRYLAATAIHTVKFVALFAIFSRETFVALLLAEAAAGFISSFWWGALEAMRGRLRHLYREGRAYVIPREVERWLTISIVCAAVTAVAGAAGVLGWIAAGPGGFGPAHLYAVALVVRVALQFVTRTFHSGTYAIRRIYRPLWAVVGLEVAGFAAVMLLWPWIGMWALPLAVLVSTVAASALTIHFTLRAARFMSLVPAGVWNPSALGRAPAPLKDLLGAGLSHAVMKLDAVLVFGLARPSDAPLGGVELFVLFFLISPAVQAGFDWAQLFYFDLKRLEPRPLAPLLDHYRRFMTRVAWLAGITFWALGSLTATIVYTRSLGILYAWLLPFFVARSLVASTQVQAFCARRYGTLLGTATLWIAAFLAATSIDSTTVKLGVVTCATVLVYVALRGVAFIDDEAPYWVGLPDWMSRLTRVDGPARVWSLRLRRIGGVRTENPVRTAREAELREQRTARQIAGRLRGEGAVTILPSHRILWYQAGRARAISPEWLIATCGGAVAELTDTGLQPDGRAALAAAWQSLGVAAALGGLELDAPAPVSLSDLERRFAAFYPDGLVCRPGQAAAPSPLLTAKSRGRIITDAARFVTSFRRGRARSPLDVTALCERGHLRLVFVARRGPRNRARRWHEVITRANVAAAVGRVVD